jgi:uncharacterized protein (TIGR03437 family)
MRSLALYVFLFLLSVPGFSQILPGRYILILQDPPVSTKFSSRADVESSAGLAYRRQIETKQASIKAELASRNIGVTGSVSVLGNYIFVAAPSSRVDELRAIPGVADVRPMRKFKPKLDRATAILNGPVAWTALGGIANAGLGMKIGIIDSGIDQNHPAFQDPTLPMPSGFPKCTTGYPADCAYTNNKVIVARSYVRLLAAGSSASNPAADSAPDDYSPRDRQGHGTGVASSAAAAVTVTPGVSSTGGPITIQGMAPKAYLGNYKIAGSAGVDEFASDATLIMAVEDAYSDGMDVITTSWGSNALSDYASDPTAAAYEAAAKGGAIVLSAAGNAGEDGVYGYDSFNTISSPSNAPDVISVGASENSHVMLPAVTLNGANVPANLVGIPAQPSDTFNYPSSQGANTAPLVDVTTLGDTGLACSALPANSLNGSYALVERGTCTFAVKATNVQAAGGVGMILYWADSSPVTIIEGVGANNPTDANFAGPIVAVSNAAGIALKSFIDANPGLSVTIAAGATEMDLSAWAAQYGYNDTATGFSPSQASLAAFSSFGPTPDGKLKPDMLAVGGNDIGYLFPDPNDFFVPAPSGIFMATQSYDPNQTFGGGTEFSANGYWAADGTSFATPMTAGAAALVKQARPGLRGTQIRSLLVNSASQIITSDDAEDPVDAKMIGNGLLDAGAAIGATVTAEPATISFGVVNAAAFPIVQTITLTNIGKTSVTLATSVSCCLMDSGGGTIAAGQPTNASISASPASITIAAGASAALTVTLSGKAPAAGAYSGAVLLTAGSTVTRIPFLLIEGDGVPYNVLAFIGAEGVPGADTGPQIVQVTDQYGAAVAGSPVTFSISPRNAFTLKSVSGEPACTVTTASATCNTDQFGFAYAELVNGSNARQATISTTVAGNPFSATVNIQNPPTITSVLDSASGATTLAPGSYVSIYGTGLSNSTSVNGTAYNPNISAYLVENTDPIAANGYPALPLHIDYVTVSFDVPSAGISVPAHISYVSPTQVNIQVPWELQGQSSAQVKVTLNGDLIGNVVTVPIANAAPSMFVYNSIAIGTDLSGNLLTAANPAKRGNIIILYANGLGPVNNQPASGDPAGVPLSTSVTTPTVTIGGQNAVVGFSGLVPGLPGLYQLNVTVPSGISTGTQNITIMAGGVTSASSTLPIQ